MADRPILLLPVRLETRFLATGTGWDLWVRVYPDEVGIDAHDPRVTQEEDNWGTEFWAQASGKDQQTQVAAWTQLARRFGPPRAAWIACLYNPSSTVLIRSRNRSWDRAVMATTLPDHWVVRGYDASGNQLFSLDGQQISPAPMPVGPSPGAMDPGQRSSGLPKVDDGMLWMVDRDTAEREGMAIRVPLTLADRQSLKRLLVIGQRSGDATTLVRNLFEAHHYSSGLSFVPQGTPTNNSADAPSGYQSTDGFDEETLALELGTALGWAVPSTDKEVDGQRVA